MTTTQIRSKLHKSIDQVDERFLSAMYVVTQQYLKKTSSALQESYTFYGKPMSIEKLKKRIQEAEARIDAGQYTTQEELEKEMKKW